MLRTFSLFLLFTLSANFIHAQELETTTLNQYFDAIEQADRFMGSVAISKNGDLVYQRSIGYSDFENEVKMDENTKFRIGSISKTFTATLIMKAVEEQKLSLDITLDKYFKDIPNSEIITLKHLLQHRSGIYNFTSAEDYLEWNTQFITKENLLAKIKSYDSVFEPGSAMEYSNSNYVLLTFILEDAFGMSYSDILNKYITEPLKLGNTYNGAKINAENNEAKSYVRSGKAWKIENETDMSVPLGAGSIASTPTDILIFANALFKNELLTAESLQSMKTTTDGFGLGLFQIPFYDKIGYGHTGGIDGFSSLFSYFEDGDIAIAWTSNASNINTNDISIALLSAAYGMDIVIPEFTDFTVDTELLDLYVGEYVSEQLPIAITISRDGDALVGQATGQPSFPLEATGENRFGFEQAGLVLEFNPEKNEMILFQMGGEFLFTKK